MRRRLPILALPLLLVGCGVDWITPVEPPPPAPPASGDYRYRATVEAWEAEFSGTFRVGDPRYPDIEAGFFDVEGYEEGLDTAERITEDPIYELFTTLNFEGRAFTLTHWLGLGKDDEAVCERMFVWTLLRPYELVAEGECALSRE